jgi:hypothetical protein
MAGHSNIWVFTPPYLRHERPNPSNLYLSYAETRTRRDGWLAVFVFPTESSARLEHHWVSLVTSNPAQLYLKSAATRQRTLYTFPAPRLDAPINSEEVIIHEVSLKYTLGRSRPHNRYHIIHSGRAIVVAGKAKTVIVVDCVTPGAILTGDAHISANPLGG